MADGLRVTPARISLRDLLADCELPLQGLACVICWRLTVYTCKNGPCMGREKAYFGRNYVFAVIYVENSKTGQNRPLRRATACVARVSKARRGPEN